VAPGKAGERPCRGLRWLSIPDPRVRAAFVGLICPSGPPGQGCETNCPSAGRSSGSLVFPAPSLAFCRHRPGLRGLSGTRAAHRPEPVRGSPRELDLPFKALERWRGPALADPSSLGIRKVCPLADMPAARLLPGSRSPLRPDGYQPSGPDPSSWFLPTSTVSSARRSRVCCTPQPDKGSSRFTLTGARRPRPSEDGPEHGTLAVALPATRFTPFEVFPSPTAAPHHCGRCLLAVTVPPKRAHDPTR